MPFQVTDGPSANEEIGQALGSAAGLALASPLGAKMLFGGLKLGAKTAWGTAKVAVPLAARAAVRVGRAAALPAAEMGFGYGKAGIKGAIFGGRGLVGGSIYGAAKTGAWIYRNPGTALAAAAPLGLGLAAFSSEREAGLGQVASPNVTDVMGGVSGQSGVSALMQTMSASGQMVLGMHNRR
jgi:hypothetical protein